VWAVAPLVGAALGYGYGGYGYGYGYGYPGYGYGYYPGYYGYSDGYYSQPSYYYSQPTYYSQSTYSQPSYTTQPATSGQDQYLGEAVRAFQSGDYQGAERLAHHTAIDEPRNGDARLLLCLAAIANGDMRTAATEAREVVNLGGVPPWPQVYAFYQNVDRFTGHLRSLESMAKQNPQDADAHMLLGFLYLSTGYRTDAQEQLAMAEQQMPNDRIIGSLMSQACGSVPMTASLPATSQDIEGSRSIPMGSQPQAGGVNNVPGASSGNAAAPQHPAPLPDTRDQTPSTSNPPADNRSLPPPPTDDGTSSGNNPSNVQPPSARPEAPTDTSGART